jgi:hypothetical protein
MSAFTMTASMLVAGLASAPTASGAPSSASGSEAQAATAGTCTTTKLTGSKPIRTRSGKKLGTAQMFAATSGEDLGFCVRIKPIKPLRKTTTQALLPHSTYFPDGQRSSSGLVGGSGAWRDPFLVTGSDFGTGYSMKATAKIVVPGGPSGKAKIEGTLS